MRTYFNKTTGAYLGSWNYPPTSEQIDHPEHHGHLWKKGQIYSGRHRMDTSTGTVIEEPEKPATLTKLDKLVAWAVTMGYKP